MADGPAPTPPRPTDADEIRDELPDDLDAAGYVGPYKFPDNSRRRWPGLIYLAFAVVAVVVWATVDAPFVTGGWLWGALVLAAAGVFSVTSSWRMKVDETAALVAAHGAVGFPVGHASAQQVWRGLRSRPTWRVLCYSADEPPTQRGLVLVDAVDGTVVEYLVEENFDEGAEVATPSDTVA
jgi:hypothetical protein